MKIAFITYNGNVQYSPANGFDEIHGLLPYLQDKGLNISYEIWDDQSVDWAGYDVALLRMPWDYYQKFEAFGKWLTKIESLGIRLFNDFDIIRWNIDKHYLKEIADAGFPVIPSIFLNSGWTENPLSLFDKLKSDQIIIKPCVSAGSHNTIKLNRASPLEASAVMADLLKEGDYLVQPFMSEIKEGEWSFVFFDGKYSHTILKKPAENEFRVQQFFGGTIERVEPDPVQIELAASYLSHFAPGTLYARVDGLMVNGQFVLMELELVEPFLYLAYHPDAPNNFYRAILTQTGA